MYDFRPMYTSPTRAVADYPYELVASTSRRRLEILSAGRSVVPPQTSPNTAFTTDYTCMHKYAGGQGAWCSTGIITPTNSALQLSFQTRPDRTGYIFSEGDTSYEPYPE